MIMHRIFHPVGQGAFYTEEFRSVARPRFTTVYDCGTDYVFTYRDLGLPPESSANVIRKLNRMADMGVIQRLSKGRFYKPKQTMFGSLKPSQQEVVKDLLKKEGKIIGYLTGVSIFGQLGVTTQISNIIEIGVIGKKNIGFYNLLEAARHSYDNGETGVEHFVYASSSSVYGSNKKVPYSTDDKVDNPVSLYAATKKSNELMAHAYSKLYNIPSTGLRFFTVYGPAGRPDMAYFGFTNKLREGKAIQIFNYGNCKRDFTYVDDIVEGVVRIMQHAPEKQNGEDGLPIPPYKVYNIGNNSPENLLDFVTILQEELIAAKVLPADYDFEAHKELVPMQPGDVPVTYADTTPLEQDFGFKPATSLRDGLRAFAQWYAK